LKDEKILSLSTGGFNSASGDFIHLSRHNKDGSPDSTFGSHGEAFVDLGNGETASSFVIQPDNKILIANTIINENYTGLNLVVARLTPNGALDLSFGTNGTFFIQTEEETWGEAAIALQPDGKVLLAGSTKVLRLNSNGTLDNSFGSGGIIPQNLIHTIASILLQPDGMILITGQLISTDGEPEPYILARFQKNGSFDPAFLGTGIRM